MIKISIDEKACVGCELCCDRCPTEVLDFDRTGGTAIVVKQEDCIQCLSCYYLCPATAVEHEGAEQCPDFHRDIETLGFAKGIL
jgi:L-aspartate semialdehyde sulfurtransferase ferredoxin